MRPLHAQEVQQAAQVLVVGEGSFDHLGLSEATQVEAYDPVSCGEGRNLALPHHAVRDPRVHENERLTLPRDLVVDPRAVDLRHANLSMHIFPFPPGPLAYTNGRSMPAPALSPCSVVLPL